MARQKKDYISLHIKMDANLMEHLNQYCDKVGWTKTLAVERMIAEFLETHDHGSAAPKAADR